MQLFSTVRTELSTLQWPFGACRWLHVRTGLVSDGYCKVRKSIRRCAIGISRTRQPAIPPFNVCSCIRVSQDLPRRDAERAPIWKSRPTECSLATSFLNVPWNVLNTPVPTPTSALTSSAPTPRRRHAKRKAKKSHACVRL